jgi:hypothetical protein
MWSRWNYSNWSPSPLYRISDECRLRSQCFVVWRPWSRVVAKGRTWSNFAVTMQCGGPRAVRGLREGLVVLFEVEVQRAYAHVMEVETHDLMIPYRCLCRCLVSVEKISIPESLHTRDFDRFKERPFPLCSARLHIGCSDLVHARINTRTGQVIVSAEDNSIPGNLDMRYSDCFEERHFLLCSARLRVGCSRTRPWCVQE